MGSDVLQLCEDRRQHDIIAEDIQGKVFFAGEVSFSISPFEGGKAGGEVGSAATRDCSAGGLEEDLTAGLN